MRLNFDDEQCEILGSAVSPLEEAAAYEALWDLDKTSFKSISTQIQKFDIKKVSDLLLANSTSEFLNYYKKLLLQIFKERNLPEIGIRIKGTLDYPDSLMDEKHPLEVLYYQGNWDLINEPSVSIVGARLASEEGKRRARKLAQGLVSDGYTIVSGLAAGIDTAAHKAALEFGGKTIAVIGTPLTEYYPKQNKELQEKIRNQFLLISQVPFIKYSKQNYRLNRLFFPERNKTMSAITKATIIVEASDTSGSLTQAKAAISQGRKLFILDSCFENKNITWPLKYQKLGAFRVKSYADIKSVLSKEMKNV